MERIVAYINDLEQARHTIVPLLAAQAAPTGWVMVICTPRLTHRIGRWASQRSREQWRERWAQQLQRGLQPVLEAAAGNNARFEWMPARGSLLDLTERLRRQHGDGLRVLDARRPRLGTSLSPVVEGQAEASAGPVAAPVAVTSALSLMLALAD